MKGCNCNFAERGRCAIRFDQMWRERNQRLVDTVTQLGWWAFSQEERRRLNEKAQWMVKLGVEAVCEVDCEATA